MGNTALEVVPNQSITMQIRSVESIKVQREAIVTLMRDVMNPNQDYGKIPGAGDRNTLLKPGAEKLLSLFHLAVDPQVEDLSTPDTIRYRIRTIVTSNGVFIGAGVGEASSAESKYQWRAAVCEEEFNETPTDRRRVKWKKGSYSVKQVRADMEDIGNTVLKMAKKRSMVDAVLTCTAASDIFAQDLEDLATTDFDPAVLDAVYDEDAPPVAQPPRQEAIQRKQPQQQSGPAQQPSGRRISEAQSKLFYGRSMGAGRTKEDINEFLTKRGYKRSEELLASEFEAALAWASGQA